MLILVAVVAIPVLVKGEELVAADSQGKEFSAKNIKFLVVSNFDVPVSIIADSGKTIRIASGVPLDAVTMAYHGDKFVIIGGSKAQKRDGIVVGSGASSFAGKVGKVTQETHGDSSPIIMSSGDVTITYGETEGVRVSESPGIIIRIPRKMKVQTEHIYGNLKIRP